MEITVRQALESHKLRFRGFEGSNKHVVNVIDLGLPL